MRKELKEKAALRSANPNDSGRGMEGGVDEPGLATVPGAA